MMTIKTLGWLIPIVATVGVYGVASGQEPKNLLSAESLVCSGDEMSFCFGQACSVERNTHSIIVNMLSNSVEMCVKHPEAQKCVEGTVSDWTETSYARTIYISQNPNSRITLTVNREGTFHLGRTDAVSDILTTSNSTGLCAFR